MATLFSAWAATPIDLSLPLSHETWSGAESRQMSVDGGFVLAKNDAQFLYLALDFTADTGNDPGTGDYFWLSFDRNRNRAITPNVDVNYGNYPNQPNRMGRQFYLGPNSWSGLLNEVSAAECRSAFEASPNASTPHRIWKIRIPLADLSVSLLGSSIWLRAPFTRFGVRTSSGTPAVTRESPVGFSGNFTGLHTLYLSRKTVVPATDLGPVIGSVGLIPTTKIDATTGKATTDAAYSVTAQNDAFGGLLNLIGNRTRLDALRAAGATQYRVFKAEGGGAFSEFRSGWVNYRWTGTDYELEPFGPNAAGFYPMPSAGVDYSIDDLLIQFDSTKLTSQQHRFRVEFFNAGGAVVAAPAQILTLAIDNNVPQVRINAVRHAGANIPTCAVVQMGSPSDGVVVNYDANDTEGNLHSYSLTASWGDGSSSSVESATYTIAMGPNWTGVSNRNSPVFTPAVTCAHSFTVHAWARTTNGYGRIGHNSASRFVTLLK